MRKFVESLIKEHIIKRINRESFTLKKFEKKGKLIIYFKSYSILKSLV
jgi:hypothetical protein